MTIVRSKHRRRLLGLAAIAIALLPAAGCFRSHGTSVDGGVDAGDTRDDAGIEPLRFSLTFLRGVTGSRWVAAWDAASDGGHWLDILRDDSRVHWARSCSLCSCDECGNCPLCGAPCMDATELLGGASVEATWDEVEYPRVDCPDGVGTCQQERSATAGSYTARFCWSASVSGGPCNQMLGELECVDIPFQLPAPVRQVDCVVGADE